MQRSLSSVSSPAAEVRIIASGLEFPEGPVALPDGSVLVTEIAAGTLAKVFPDGSIERIAYITCSGTGHLIAVEWPRPGGLLAFPRKVRT